MVSVQCQGKLICAVLLSCTRLVIMICHSQTLVCRTVSFIDGCAISGQDHHSAPVLHVHGDCYSIQPGSSQKPAETSMLSVFQATFVKGCVAPSFALAHIHLWTRGMLSITTKVMLGVNVEVRQVSGHFLAER